MSRKLKNTKIGDTVSRFRDDYEYRATVSAAASIFVSLFFAAYNFVLWLKKGYEWNIGIAVYYALLCAVRAVVVIAEIRASKSSDEGLKNEKNRGVCGRFYLPDFSRARAFDRAYDSQPPRSRLRNGYGNNRRDVHDL